MSIEDIFAKLNNNKKTEPSASAEWLIVGLGNPGETYEGTRHNAGFMAIDALAKKHGVEIKNLKFNGMCAKAVINSKNCLLLKPQTLMNNSGISVAQAASFYKIPIEKTLIMFDDINLDVGEMRIKRKGSDGGHNGIKSIIAHLGTNEFPRIKVGVGKKPHPDYDLAHWVLGRFFDDDKQALNTVLDNAAAAAELIIDGKTDEAMNKFN